MSDLVEKGILQINAFVNQWTSKYLFQTSYQEETQSGHTFMTEFSLPTPSKPVPVATVKVFFYVPDLTDLNEKRMSFRFENDSLIHQVERTIRLSQMEKWLEQILNRKSRTSRILFLGTQFEETRISDTRMVELFAEQPKIVPKEEKYLLPELLDSISELQNQGVVDPLQQEKEIRVLRETLFEVFRQIDTNDLGMVSHEECLEVFKLMGLNLNKFQQDEILANLDITKTGIIQYEELVPLGADMMHAIFSKNQAIKDLQDKEDESKFQANIMLITDQIHDIFPLLAEEAKLHDEDETHFIDHEKFKELLVAKAEVLNQTEVEMVMRELTQMYPDKIPYLKIEPVFHKIIYSTLLSGLASSAKSKLEDYLVKLFEQYDNLNNGIIHINDVITALRISDKLMLSKVQLYIIQSFLTQDPNNLVEYRKETKVLAAIIKKFFNIDLLVQKHEFSLQSSVSPDTDIKPRTLQELQKDLLTIGK